MDHPPIDNPVDAELRLVDVVVRHGIDQLELTPVDFGDTRCSRYWRAITTIWDRGERPSIENVHVELVAMGTHTQLRDACDLMFLPLGYRRHLDDYVALILRDARRRRAQMAFGDAEVAVAHGADPDAVLARLVRLVG